MKGKTEQIALHSPTLASVQMVEETIQEYSGEFTRYQLWRKLPRSMMYQTFILIIDYLLENHRIAADSEGKIGWTWDPELAKKIMKHAIIMK